LLIGCEIAVGAEHKSDQVTHFMDVPRGCWWQLLSPWYCGSSVCAAAGVVVDDDLFEHRDQGRSIVGVSAHTITFSSPRVSHRWHDGIMRA
jgi:hypothetical protein